MSQKEFDNLTRATAKFVHDTIVPLTERIEKLESDLAYARSEAEKALTADLRRHLGDDDPAPTMARLERMHEQKKAGK